MSRFSHLTWKVSTSDGRHFTLIDEPIEYRSDVILQNHLIVMPVGTQFDGASTPWGGWNVFPPFGPWWRAAGLHDFLYRGTKLPKDACDKVFLEAMIDCEVDTARANAMYLAVLKMGAGAFNQRREHANV